MEFFLTQRDAEVSAEGRRVFVRKNLDMSKPNTLFD